MPSDIINTLYCSTQDAIKDFVMSYIDLVKKDADATDIQAFLIGGNQTAITIRIPENLRDSAKEAAALRGTTFSSFVRECMIKELTKHKREE